MTMLKKTAFEKKCAIFALILCLGLSIILQSQSAKANQDAGLMDFSEALLNFKKAEPRKTQNKKTADISVPKPGIKPENLNVKQSEDVRLASLNKPLPSKKPSLTSQEKPQATTISKAPETFQKQKRFVNQSKSLKALSSEDVERYKNIFVLQKQGKMKQADALIAKLDDNRLYGYALHQRYLHPTAYKSSFSELRNWLDKYSDHIGAQRIYNLAEKKRPRGNNVVLKQPDTKIKIRRRGEPTMKPGEYYVSARNRSNIESTKVRSLQKQISKAVNAGQTKTAYSLLNNAGKDLLDTVEYDLLRAKIAAGTLYQGNWKQAKSLAEASAKRSGLHAPLASWVAGIVAWQDEDYTNAANFFESVSRSSYASSWTKSAGAYWAARSHMRRGDVKSVSIWLRRAASSPRTFYGLIATRALGENFAFNWGKTSFAREDHMALSRDSRGARAIALVQIGQTQKGQDELLRIDIQGKPVLQNALVSFANYTRMPAVAMRLGALESANQGHYYDSALYPLSPWQPRSGYKVDPALIHAIMRQESRFNPSAKSPSGARGLMQLMPATAKSLTHEKSFDMNDPAKNLELGQRYLLQLLSSPHVDNDLLSLLIAYNAGPGNLSKWRNRWSRIQDPLLFIELLPSAETRAYVERVLSNYWIYRFRDQKQTPTLDAVVAGTPVKLATRESVLIQTASAQ